MSIDERRLQTLKETFSGDLLLPDAAGYDEARRLYNGLIDKRPALIARPRSSADAAAAVAFAREGGLEISIRGGGHGVAGRAVADGALTIDLSLMKQVIVDPEARTARAGGGANWGEFNDATAEHGLATTGGLISTTGIAGLTLGGGLGWLMGKYGLAADNLVSAEIVTADGRGPNGERRAGPRPVLGGPGRGGELRRGDDPRVPAPPGRPGHRRPGRPPVRRGA